MKKALSFIIAVMMLMQMLTFTVSAASFSVNWDSGHKGMIIFPRSQSEKVEYSLGIYKDSMYVEGYNFSYWGNSSYGEYYLGPEIEKAGNGSYEVVVSYTDANGNLVTAKTAPYNYKQPSAKMQKVTGVRFNESTGVATWNAVPDAYYYEVELLFKDPYEGYYYAPVYGNAYEYTSYDFSEDGELDMFYEELNRTAEDYGISVSEIETAVRVVAYCQNIETKSSSVSDYYSFNGAFLQTNPNTTGTITDYYWNSYGTVREPIFQTAENNYYYIAEIFKDDKSLGKIPKYEWSPGIYYSSAEEVKFIMADNGEGSYHFTVTDSNGNMVTSEKYNYVPGKPLTAPYNLSSNGNVFSWECDDLEVSHYEIELFLTYKDSNYYERVYHDRVYNGTQYELEKWYLTKYNNAVAYNHEKDSVNKNKENARLAFRVYSIPKSSTYTPGASNYLVEGKEIEANKPQEEPLAQVDRSAAEGNKYYEEIKICYDLGLTPDIYTKVTSNVTKGDLAVALVKLLGTEDIAKTYNNTDQFSDLTVGTDINGCAVYLCERNIILRENNSTFGVDTEITLAQFCKMIVDILGYKTIAEIDGGYPSGYMYVANRYGVTKNLTLSSESTITNAQLTQLLVNSLEVKIREQTSFGYNEKYEITDDTLLYRLGLGKLIGKPAIEERKVTVSGILKDEGNMKGVEVIDRVYTNYDYDLPALNGKASVLYVKGNKVISGVPNYVAEFTINNGDESTKNQIVTLCFKVGGYTKYKVEDGEYKKITGNASYKLPSRIHGSQSVKVTFANDNETKTVTLYDSITFENLHKLTYMADGKVFESKMVGFGEEIGYLTQTPSLEGHWFSCWEPSITHMPDEDVTVYAKFTPYTTVTGKITYNGEVAANKEVYVLGSTYTTDADGNFWFTYRSGIKQMTTLVSNYLSKSVYLDLTGRTFDLGTVDFTRMETTVADSTNLISSVTGLENAFDQEDRNYIDTTVNSVTVNVSVKSAEQTEEITKEVAKNFTDYEVVQNIDIKIEKYQGLNAKEVTETEGLLGFEVALPDESKGKSSYIVLREHEGSVDALTTTPNVDGEYFIVNRDSILIYAKKFSVYSLAATEVVSATKTDTGVSLTINLNEQVVKDSALMIVKAYDKRGVQLASKAIPVTSAYSDTVTLQCEGATGYKLLFFSGLANIKPVYSPINGNL